MLLFDAVRGNDEKKVRKLVGRCPPLHSSLDAHGRSVLHHAVFKVKYTLYYYLLKGIMLGGCFWGFFLTKQQNNKTTNNTITIPITTTIK